MTQRIQRLIVDCATALFKAYGVMITPSWTLGAPAPASVDPLDSRLSGCIIDLRPTGSEAGSSPPGKLLFLSTFAFIAASRPMHGVSEPLSPASAGHWIYVRDWTRELTNQLAGRVTNHLAAGGQHFSPGRPMALTGVAASRELKSMGGVQVRFMSSDAYEVCVALVLPKERGTSGPRTKPPTGAPGEGSVTMLDEDDDA